MPRRPLTYIAAGLLVAGCDSAAANKSAAPPSTTVAASDTQARTTADALLADAAVAEAAGDLMSARQFLTQALDSEPNDARVRAHLAALGGLPPQRDTTRLTPPPSTLALTPPAAPVTAPAPTPRQPVGTPTTFAATTPAAAPRMSQARTARAPITRVTVGGVAGSGRRTEPTVRAVARVEGAESRTAAPVDARTRVAALADAAVPTSEVQTVAGEVARTTPQVMKHKRTWPWTRAQRWLVAQGVTGGAGVGVVVGAIVGNVPGALLAGSLGGGAVGFKKATKIAPADPYPSERKTAEFEAKKTERGRTEATTRVAAADSAGAVRGGQLASQEGAGRP